MGGLTCSLLQLCLPSWVVEVPHHSSQYTMVEGRVVEVTEPQLSHQPCPRLRAHCPGDRGIPTLRSGSLSAPAPPPQPCYPCNSRMEPPGGTTRPPSPADYGSFPRHCQRAGWGNCPSAAPTDRAPLTVSLVVLTREERAGGGKGWKQ